MDKPDSVSHYEELLESGGSMYFDPVELDDIFHYYVETGDFDKVDSVLALAKRLHPDDATVMRMDTEYEANSGDPAKALEKLDRFFDAEVPFHCILRSAIFAKMQRKDEALDWAARAIEDVPPSDYVAYDLALGFMNAQMYHEAIHYFRRSLKDHPDDVRTKTGLIYCLTQSEQHDEANRMADALLELDPFSIEAWVAKGCWHRSRSEWQEAVDAFDYALAMAPDDCELLVMKGTCLSMLGKKEEAMAALEEYVEHKEGPIHSSVYLFLGDVYHTLGRDEEARQALWSAFEAEDRTFDTYVQLGHAFAAIDDHDDAVVMFEAADSLASALASTTPSTTTPPQGGREVSSTTPSTTTPPQGGREVSPSLEDPEEVQEPISETERIRLLYSLGECLSTLCRPDDAADCYRRITGLREDSNAYALWGGCLMSMGRYRAAYQQLKKATNLDPLWQTYILMATCDLEMNHPKKLEEDYQFAYILAPDEARGLLEKICPSEIERLEKEGLFARAEEAYLKYRAEKEDKLHLLAELRQALDEVLPDLPNISDLSDLPDDDQQDSTRPQDPSQPPQGEANL